MVTMAKVLVVAILTVVLPIPMLAVLFLLWWIQRQSPSQVQPRAPRQQPHPVQKVGPRVEWPSQAVVTVGKRRRLVEKAVREGKVVMLEPRHRIKETP